MKRKVEKAPFFHRAFRDGLTGGAGVGRRSAKRETNPLRFA